jgi:hypothetical protein
MLPETAEPSLHEAYVGGSFRNDASKHFGFELMNEVTWKKYILEFGDSPVSLVAVPPGYYRVIYWLIWKADEVIPDRIEPPSDWDLRQHFKVTGGHVILLGRWTGAQKPIPGGIRYKIVPIPITEAEAVGVFQRMYTHFADQSVRCLSCAP